jgi:hypothetical protein
MLFFNYFLRNAETKEQIHVITPNFLGDVGDVITGKDGTSYIIEDYADEYEYAEEPEDYDLEAAYVGYCGGYHD